MRAALINFSKVVACTQPRRVAATSVAQRVAEEMVRFSRFKHVL